MITARKAKALRQRFDALNAWRDGRTSYPADSVPRELRATNAELSALERFEFLRDKPAKYFAYYRFRVAAEATHNQTFTFADMRKGQPTRGYRIEVTTWTGEVLASGRLTGFEAWQSNLGDYRQAFEVKADNGAVYVGTAYLSAGDYCRMRLKKGS